MSEPLSDVEVAELRRLQRAVDEDTHHIDNGAENARDDAAGAALPRLLDELESLRRVVRYSAAIRNVGAEGATVLLVGAPLPVRPIKP